MKEISFPDINQIHSMNGRLTTVTRVFVGSVAAVLLLIALPSLRDTAAVVASELVLAARVFCNENDVKTKLKSLIAAEG